MDLNLKTLQIKIQQVGFSSHLVMVRPFNFYCNLETTSDNIYQIQSQQSKQEICKRAIKQFDSFVQILRQNHIKLTIVQDDGKNETPDSIYPNNWISFHQNLNAVLYPMYAPNRRKERNIALIQTIEKELSVKVQILSDYTQCQNQGLFLEGTGSMVLDRQNKIAYAVISQRTNKKLLQKFCHDLGYKQCSFHANQYCKNRKQKRPVYHTNVLMGLSRYFVLLCLQLIDNQQEKENLKKTIERESKKKIIDLTADQVWNFAGNALMDLLVMSSAAYHSLGRQQVQQIQKSTKIIHSDLAIIQKNGGGSARCMLAELF